MRFGELRVESELWGATGEAGEGIPGCPCRGPRRREPAPVAQVVISRTASFRGAFLPRFSAPVAAAGLSKKVWEETERCYSIITPSMVPFQRKQLPFLTFLVLASLLPNLLPVPRVAGAARDHPWAPLRWGGDAFPEPRRG